MNKKQMQLRGRACQHLTEGEFVQQVNRQLKKGQI